MTEKFWNYHDLSEGRPPDVMAAVRALCDHLRPMFAGQHPAVIKLALAELVGEVIIAHDERIRARQLRSHITTVKEIVPMMEAALRRHDVIDRLRPPT
jgi:hypothetical protein